MDESLFAIVQKYLLSTIGNHISVSIQNGTDSNREKLLSLWRDKRLKEKTRIVYVYSLVDESFLYPKGESKIIYIGEAYREKAPTGKRFGQHIAASDNQGGDTGTNYTLTYYYYANKKIQLDIYLLKKSINQKNVEKKMLQWFMKKYCSQPIAQGASSKNYTLNVLGRP